MTDQLSIHNLEADVIMRGQRPKKDSTPKKYHHGFGMVMSP